MKSKILGILIALLFAAGYVTLNYPVLGTLYNQIREGKVMDSYDHAVHTMDKEKRKKYWEEAEEYNAMAGDITTYAQENFLRYIIGDAPISELDSFINTCKEMGLEDCLNIKQASLDRYYERQA